MSGRNWCYTINNYDEEDVESILGWDSRYNIWGYEVGASGTPHIQGYAEFSVVKRLSAVKKLSGKAHWECRKGTREQARDYCKKDGKWEETGDWTEQGKRSDLDFCRNLAINEGMRKVTEVCNLQQIKVAEKYLTYNEEPREWETEVWWIYGKTGSGKSKCARDYLPDDCYIKNDGTKWWDGYDGHENVIMDDFRDSWWSLTEMLSLLDRYEKRVEIKGGWRQFKPRKIVVTSAKSPYDCYKGCGEDIAQLVRRVTFVTEAVTEVTKGNTGTFVTTLKDDDTTINI